MYHVTTTKSSHHSVSSHRGLWVMYHVNTTKSSHHSVSSHCDLWVMYHVTTTKSSHHSVSSHRGLWVMYHVNTTKSSHHSVSSHCCFWIIYNNFFPRLDVFLGLPGFMISPPPPVFRKKIEQLSITSCNFHQHPFDPTHFYFVHKNLPPVCEL